MKPYHALIAIAIGLTIVLTQPHLTTAHGITRENAIPLDIALAANTEDFLIQGDEKYQMGDYQGAIEDYTQAIRLNPADADAYFSRGNAYARLKDYEKAVENFTQVLRITPDNAGAYFNRGLARSLLKNDQKAIEDFTQSLQIDPNNDKTYLNRGFSHSLLKNDQKAIEDYTQSIRLNPDNDRAYFSRGFSYSNLKDYQGAIEDYTQVIHLNPDSAGAYLKRGNAHFDLKDYQEAIEDYTQTLRMNPDNAEAYFNRGKAYVNLKDDREAIRDYTQVIRLSPDNDRAYLSRGFSHSNLKDYQEAIKDFTQTIRLNPNDTEAYYARGLARSILKDNQKAIEDFTQVIKINPNNVGAKKALEQLEAKNVLNEYSAAQRFQITLFVSICLCLVWIVSISLHEFGHAIVAYWGGDTSVKTKGYLTLNPLKYTHPLVSIILPALFFCLGAFPLPGAAVYIEHQRLRNRWWQSAVSAAGPFASFLVTLFLIVLFQVSLAANAPYWLSAALAFFISLHFFFVLFNLMPFPPLDGYGIIAVWLPQRLQILLRKFALIGLIAICALSFFPPFVLSIVRSASTLTQLFGVPEALPSAGFELFNRWYCALPLIAIGVFALIRRPQALWEFLGEMMVSFQKFDLALKAYHRAIMVAPDDAQVWTRRGWLLGLARSAELSSMQQYVSSLQSFDRAIQINPGYYSPWAGRGCILSLLGRYNEAFVAYDRAAALEQNDYLVWYERGTVLVSLKRHQEALASFNRAIELRPDLDWLRKQRDLLLGIVIVNSQGAVIWDGRQQMGRVPSTKIENSKN